MVYIVEDDASFRKSMERLIRVAGYEVEAFGTANEFLTSADIRYPGCLLLDVQLPDTDGLTLQQTLNEKCSILPIVFMTGHGSIPMGIKAIKSGAVNFLVKPFKSDELLTAVREALERSANDAAEMQEKDRINTLIKTLTPREQEVLRYVIAGKLNKQTAFVLGTCEKTIKVHRSRIMRKTRVSSLAELVRLAQKADILPAG
ncbi:MAG: response regulator [Proteobacteria bacterium]|nr:response regulator [Pseudomonadota bacterium]MBU1457030.1 response regulator [Pseudomonadota bacterium]